MQGVGGGGDGFEADFAEVWEGDVLDEGDDVGVVEGGGVVFDSWGALG